MASQQHQQQQQQQQPLPTPMVDVDDLAKEKVQEVEDILDDPSRELKLESIKSCFSILKQIITAADLHRTNDKEKSENSDERSKTNQNSESIYADYADDHEQFNAVDLTEQFATNSVKWTIRVRAFKSVHRIFDLLISSPSSSSSARQASNKSALLKMLPDLVRLSFVAATSPYDDLKIQGFQMFRQLINRFASVEEREFPGHSILEQYKTQVLSALKPAFNLDAPPYITAVACQVCCQWICRGLEKEPVGLKRAFQLIEPSIVKLESQSINPNSLLYQEIELEQERLDILGSWAQLYITSNETGETAKMLRDLIKDHIDTLVDKWWEALKDYALLIMLSPRTMTNNSHDNEHVYTKEVALKLFTPIWPKLTLAVTTWLCTPPSVDDPQDPQRKKITKGNSQKYFRFLCGILMNEFCRCPQLESATDSLAESTLLSLRSLTILLTSEITNANLLDDVVVAREFYAMLVTLLVKLPSLKGAHRLTLQSASSQIFRLLTSRFKDNDKIVQYSLAQLLSSICGGIESQTTENSHKMKFTNLLVLSKARPDLLVDELLDAFIEVVRKLISQETSPSTILNIMETVQSLQKDLHKSSSSTIIERLFETKQTLLLKSISARADEKDVRVPSEPIIKSIRLDLECIENTKRQELLSSLIRTLSKDCATNDDLSKLTHQTLGDMEKCFADDFAILGQANDDMRDIIDSILKPAATKDTAKENKPEKKTVAAAARKPSSTIKLKSDFSNFYAKKK